VDSKYFDNNSMTTDEAILDKNRYLSVCLLFIYLLYRS